MASPAARGGVPRRVRAAAATPAAVRWFGPHRRGLVVGLVVAGIVLGCAMLLVIVLRFRRQAWQQRAETLARSIVKPGV